MSKQEHDSPENWGRSAFVAINASAAVLVALSIFLLTQVFSLNSRVSSLDNTVSALLREDKSAIEIIRGIKGTILLPSPAERTVSSYAIEVSGTASGLKAGQFLRLVVHRLGRSGFWPSGGPLKLEDGKWQEQVYLGRRDNLSDKGPYLIELVLVDEIAHMEFEEYLKEHTDDYPGMTLPQGAIPLDWIVVQRI